MDAVVGVVIPMYNAAETIEATLDSVLGQSHALIDVVVVDDGSTDAGPDLVERRAARDRRLRLIRQSNAGVAAARNAGAAATDAEFLAFIDADDLWARDKLIAQLEALARAGDHVGVSYSWFALIDENDRVIEASYRPPFQGDVLEDLCGANFVGNGSSILIRRSIFERVGGFDTTLRDRGGQGCEDHSLCLAAAALTEFALVPRHLTGYRLSTKSMSHNVLTMRRSCELLVAQVGSRHPQHQERLQRHLADVTNWLTLRALQGGQLGKAAALRRLISRSGAHQGPLPLSSCARVYLAARWAPSWLKAAKSALSPGPRANPSPYPARAW